MEFEIKDDDLLNQEISQHECLTLPSFNIEELSYDEFFKHFVFKNLPCVIRNISKNWRAATEWISHNEPNVDYLEKKYGHTKIMIYNCSDRYFNSQKCKDSTFTEYIKYWKNEKSSSALYLKDWHLKLQCKSENFYEVPIYFASDWLNEYYTKCLNDDYRFVYIGPKGTWTPLHADVFASYSWSVNVCGQKKWIFFFPGEENYLRDNQNNLPYDVSHVPHSRKCFEIIQNPGEAIFVPSGWYHQVWNLQDTISINHNWINGCNIFTMWESLKSNLENVKKEISDCKDMDDFEEHCQIMLKALFGINYKQFYDFLKFIAQSRISMLKNDYDRVLFHGHIIGTNHIFFDLKMIKKVLKEFLNCDDVHNKIYYSDGRYLLNKILQTLKDGYLVT